MSQRWKLLRRRPLNFWGATFYVAMWPFCLAVGTLAFEVLWWIQYKIWLPVPTSNYFDGKAFYSPETPWVVSHPVLKIIFPIPLTITSSFVTAAVVGAMVLLDESFGSGRDARGKPQL